MEKTFFVVVRFLKEANKRGVLMVLIVPQDKISCTLVNNFRSPLIELKELQVGGLSIWGFVADVLKQMKVIYM